MKQRTCIGLQRDNSERLSPHSIHTRSKRSRFVQERQRRRSSIEAAALEQPRRFYVGKSRSAAAAATVAATAIALVAVAVHLQISPSTSSCFIGAINASLCRMLTLSYEHRILFQFLPSGLYIQLLPAALPSENHVLVLLAGKSFHSEPQIFSFRKQKHIVNSIQDANLVALDSLSKEASTQSRTASDSYSCASVFDSSAAMADSSTAVADSRAAVADSRAAVADSRAAVADSTAAADALAHVVAPPAVAQCSAAGGVAEPSLSLDVADAEEENWQAASGSDYVFSNVDRTSKSRTTYTKHSDNSFSNHSSHSSKWRLLDCFTPSVLLADAASVREKQDAKLEDEEEVESIASAIELRLGASKKALVQLWKRHHRPIVLSGIALGVFLLGLACGVLVKTIQVEDQRVAAESAKAEQFLNDIAKHAREREVERDSRREKTNAVMRQLWQSARIAGSLLISSLLQKLFIVIQASPLLFLAADTGIRTGIQAWGTGASFASTMQQIIFSAGSAAAISTLGVWQLMLFPVGVFVLYKANTRGLKTRDSVASGAVFAENIELVKVRLNRETNPETRAKLAGKFFESIARECKHKDLLDQGLTVVLSETLADLQAALKKGNDVNKSCDEAHKAFNQALGLRFKPLVNAPK